MSKLSREQLKEIIKKDLPGYRVADESESEGRDERAADAPPHTAAEADSPDLNVLRSKYLRSKYLGPDAAAEDFSSDANEESALESNPSEDEDEIVAVRPEAASHPWDRSARPKAAVVSSKEKKVIGQQG